MRTPSPKARPSALTSMSDRSRQLQSGRLLPGTVRTWQLAHRRNKQVGAFRRLANSVPNASALLLTAVVRSASLNPKPQPPLRAPGMNTTRTPGLHLAVEESMEQPSLNCRQTMVVVVVVAVAVAVIIIIDIRMNMIIIVGMIKIIRIHVNKPFRPQRLG